MDKTELRKWCVEKAIEAVVLESDGQVQALQWKDIIKAAKEIEEYITSEDNYCQERKLVDDLIKYKRDLTKELTHILAKTTKLVVDSPGDTLCDCKSKGAGDYIPKPEKPSMYP